MIELGKIYNEDCLETMSRMADKSVDLVLTDPPYGVGIDYGGYEDELGRTTAFVLEFAREAVRIGRIVLFPSGKSETELALWQNFPPKWRLCWYKGSTGNISAVGFADWEMILVYGDKVCVHQHDYFYVAPERMGKWGHPCPKPLGYSKWLASRFSKPGQTVYDPFMGSGTTAIACEMLGRQWVGSEINPNYCALANKRIEEYRSQLTLAL